MTTSELIKRLQEIDPDGEKEVKYRDDDYGDTPVTQVYWIPDHHEGEYIKLM